MKIVNQMILFFILMLDEATTDSVPNFASLIPFSRQPPHLFNSNPSIIVGVLKKCMNSIMCTWFTFAVSTLQEVYKEYVYVQSWNSKIPRRVSRVAPSTWAKIFSCTTRLFQQSFSIHGVSQPVQWWTVLFIYSFRHSKQQRERLHNQN